MIHTYMHIYTYIYVHIYILYIYLYAIILHQDERFFLSAASGQSHVYLCADQRNVRAITRVTCVVERSGVYGERVLESPRVKTFVLVVVYIYICVCVCDYNRLYIYIFNSRLSSFTYSSTMVLYLYIDLQLLNHYDCRLSKKHRTGR